MRGERIRKGSSIAPGVGRDRIERPRPDHGESPISSLYGILRSVGRHTTRPSQQQHRSFSIHINPTFLILRSVTRHLYHNSCQKKQKASRFSQRKDGIICEEVRRQDLAPPRPTRLHRHRKLFPISIRTVSHVPSLFLVLASPVDHLTVVPKLFPITSVKPRHQTATLSLPRHSSHSDLAFPYPVLVIPPTP